MSEKMVLVVDDSLTARMFAVEVMREGGYAVVEADSGEAALEVAAGLGDELILLVTDVLMPGIKGPELAHRLREARPSLPIIVTSGYSGDVDLGELLREPGVRFIKKPASPDELLEAASELMGP